jgi:hypothetical protein
MSANRGIWAVGLPLSAVLDWAELQINHGWWGEKINLNLREP